MVTPTPQGATVVVFVEVAFKALIDMKDIAETRCDERVACVQRPLAAAADQYDRSGVHPIVGRCAAEQEFSNFSHEMRIDDPVGLVYPGDMQSARRVPDPEIFHRRSDIDQYGPWIALQSTICGLCTYGFCGSHDEETQMLHKIF